MKDIASLLPEKVISDIRAIFQSEIGCIGVVEPKKLIVQYQKFEKVIQQHRVSCGIHYVMKCNTSMKLIQTIQTLGGRIDVSSIGELEKALVLGVPPTLISANGPKNTLFLRKCIQENVYIIVDSIHELEEILRLSQELKSRPSILIRISGFTGHRPSRFGVHISLWETCIQRLSEYKDILSFQGISFHVDSADIPLRRKIFWESQTFVRGCITQGLHTKIIDIGGSYGERPDDDRSLEERITRSDGFIFPVQEITGEDFLSEVLSIPERWYPSIGTYLYENGTTLWIEPGRSLLHGVGYTATKVISLQSIPEAAIILDTNSFSLGTRESEIPSNPLYLSIRETSSSRLKDFFLLGNLCREKDRLLSRSVLLPDTVYPGDILIFPDTAGYRMDFFETRSILHPPKTRYFQTSLWLQIDQ